MAETEKVDALQAADEGEGIADPHLRVLAPGTQDVAILPEGFGEPAEDVEAGAARPHQWPDEDQTVLVVAGDDVDVRAAFTGAVDLAPGGGPFVGLENGSAALGIGFEGEPVLLEGADPGERGDEADMCGGRKGTGDVQRLRCHTCDVAGAWQGRQSVHEATPLYPVTTPRRTI